MSASREKQIRQDQAAAGQVDSAVVHEEENRKSQKRSSVLYGVIVVLFLIALVGAVVWRSNVISKAAPAVTIDGEKYNAAEVTFYYQNAYQGFVNNNYYLVSYIGLDPYSSLKAQTINETAAAWTGAEVGQTWHDYFMDQALLQMAAVQNGLKAAEDEGFEFPASIELQHDEAMVYLASAAAGAGVSSEQYLKNSMGSVMTEKVYSQELTRILQFEAYTTAYADSLTYSNSEIESAYKEATQYYDEVDYEYVYISGAAESTTDDTGNTVEPTAEENERAMTLARATADSILAAYKAGESLETAAEISEDAMYNTLEGATYSGDPVTEWLFDDARTAGDAAVLENGTSVYVTVFQERGRNEENTIDVRHILIQPAAGTLTSEDEGYEAEQAELKAVALAEANDILDQWKSGEATEESFAQLAMQHSMDGNKYQGGIYTAVRPGDMVTEFNDWCFDSSRKTGDTDVVETPYGAHVMYFSGNNLPYWQTLVVSDLQSADYNEWVSAFSTSSTVTEGFGMKFIA